MESPEFSQQNSAEKAEKQVEIVEFSPEGKKFIALRKEILAPKEFLANPDNEELEEVVSKSAMLIHDYCFEKITRYSKDDNSKEVLARTEMWHVVIGSQENRAFKKFDLDGEESIRLFLIKKALPQVNAWRVEAGLSEINPDDFGISEDIVQ